MASIAFIEALAESAEDGKIDLGELRDKCLAAIMAGEGVVDFVTGATGGGKSVSAQCRMGADELLAAVNQAIRHKDGKSVNLTYADFSDLR